MSEELFIIFDSFLVKKSDIIFAVHTDKHEVKLTIKKGSETHVLTMQYEDSYDAKHALEMLGIKTDAITLNHHKTALVQQMGWMTSSIRNIGGELEKVKKELNSLRMELRRNRLNVKKDKQK